ncbi:hypothetical protein [Blastococcus brunescens]|uniref:Uncharacterized protein n=1 Tax=Blastococcus brunescens TaxID=1564165 RepID=A0ABZ1AV16_9ACTN|nr:hypothetical protein [Blastococcus sp. BMG 8361]WRL62392.1 hypothetical protein U6N30_20525 [Blastococcus sp. BMG 8361]
MTDDFQGHLDRYLGDRDPAARYSSFDYCFNWFQGHREEGRLAELTEPAALQVTCLHLGFYLASWGMYRGGAQLLRHSAKSLEPVVRAVVEAPQEIWDVDLDGYSSDGMRLVLRVGGTVRQSFPGRTSDTLVTKAMLGVFGCVPAYDRFFRQGFGVSSFGQKSLQRLGRFWADHQDVIERNRVNTLDFDSGRETRRRYTRAKVVDMLFFMKGGGGPAVAAAT